MMQNSLDRLFGGICTALREDVRPALEDRYAQAQIDAAIELLANIAEHVAWKPYAPLPAGMREFHAAEHARFTAARRRMRDT